MQVLRCEIVQARANSLRPQLRRSSEMRRGCGLTRVRASSDLGARTGASAVEFNLFIVQLAILLLPGMIWARVDAQYASKTKPSDVEFFVRAFVFGVISYVFTFVLYQALSWPFEAKLPDANQTGISGNLAWQVGIATTIGFVLSILWLYATTKKWLTRILQLIGATAKYGDEDVWDFTFNSSVAPTSYVHFRDFENQIVYAGWVTTFSETGKLRELVLSDVQIWNFEAQLLFEAPSIYIARAPELMHIEFPFGGRVDG